MDKQKLEQLKEIINEFKTKEMKERNEQSPFITSKVYDIITNSGLKLKRAKLQKGGKDGSAAIIIPYVGNDVLLLCIEPRVFTELTVGVGFPAGYIEEGENPKEAALRELREETGLVPERIEEVDAFYQDEGCSAAFNHIFIAYGCKKEYEQELDQDEYIRYMNFTTNDVFELEELGYINTANSKLCLSHVRKMKGR